MTKWHSGGGYTPTIVLRWVRGIGTLQYLAEYGAANTTTSLEQIAAQTKDSSKRRCPNDVAKKKNFKKQLCCRTVWNRHSRPPTSRGRRIPPWERYLTSKATFRRRSQVSLESYLKKNLHTLLTSVRPSLKVLLEVSVCLAHQ